MMICQCLLLMMNSIFTLSYFYQISYNKLLMKKKEMANEDKHKVVQECIDAIGEKYAELAYKHDGCRVL